jgi:hypothetical protein
LATRTGAVEDILGPDLYGWLVEVDDLDGFTGMLRRFHGETSSRAYFVNAIRGMRDHWTEEAYGSRLRSAIEQRFTTQPVSLT